MTPWQRHVQRWKDCRLCSLCDKRSRVVLYRGQLPCDVLFVGEAPGRSEDSLGEPFVGPAGLLLDNDLDPPGIIQRAALRESGLRLGFGNLLACIPLDQDGDKVEEPPDDSVKACSERLLELVDLARPKVIVTVGACARDWLDPSYIHSIKVDRDIPRVHMDHPAYILRAPWAQKNMLVNRSVQVLRAMVRDYRRRQCQS
jgi:DNA polymerase